MVYSKKSNMTNLVGDASENVCCTFALRGAARTQRLLSLPTVLRKLTHMSQLLPKRHNDGL